MFHEAPHLIVVQVSNEQDINKTYKETLCRGLLLDPRSTLKFMLQTFSDGKNNNNNNDVRFASDTNVVGTSTLGEALRR